MTSPLAGFSLFISTRPRFPAVTGAIHDIGPHGPRNSQTPMLFEEQPHVLPARRACLPPPSRIHPPRFAGHGMVTPRLASGEGLLNPIRVPAGYPGIPIPLRRIFHDPCRGGIHKIVVIFPRQDLGATLPCPAQGGASSHDPSQYVLPSRHNSIAVNRA